MGMTVYTPTRGRHWANHFATANVSKRTIYLNRLALILGGHREELWAQISYDDVLRLIEIVFCAERTKASLKLSRGGTGAVSLSIRGLTDVVGLTDVEFGLRPVQPREGGGLRIDLTGKRLEPCSRKSSSALESFL